VDSSRLWGSDDLSRLQVAPSHSLPSGLGTSVHPCHTHRPRPVREAVGASRELQRSTAWPRPPCLRGRSCPRGLQPVPGLKPLGRSTPSWLSRVSPPSSSHLPVSRPARRARRTTAPLAQFQALRVVHRCGEPHGFQRFQLAVNPGGEETAATRAAKAGQRWCQSAGRLAGLDQSSRGRPALLAVRAPTRCRRDLPARLFAASSNRPALEQTGGRPLGCQIRPTSGAIDQGLLTQSPGPPAWRDGRHRH